MITPFNRITVLCSCVVALAGCVSLLPPDKPVDLYRFEPAMSQSSGSAGERSVSVVLGAGTFAREAAGDRILALTGGEVAYVAGARWALPSEILFRQAVTQVFADTAGPARLLQRADLGRADFSLSLDVVRFETQYQSGPGQPPTVLVQFHALLVQTSDRTIVGEATFQAQVVATDNRVSTIVVAYDGALSDSLAGLSAWVQMRVSRPA